MNSDIDERIDSLRALINVLREAIEQPAGSNAKRIEPWLTSQAKVAKFDWPELGISGCSLNTLKRTSRLVDGGFYSIDRLRRNALTAIRKSQAEQIGPGENSRRRLQLKAQQLEDNFNSLFEDLVLATRILEKAMRQARQYAAESRNEDIIERCRREQLELRDMMSLQQISLPRLKVVHSRGLSE